MAAFTSNIICKSFSPTPTPTPTLYPNHHQFPCKESPLIFRSPAVRFSDELTHRRLRVVTRAGPTTTQYIFAFVFPFSLLAITAFSAFQIGNKLDQKFLEELAMNEEIRKAEEEDEEDSDIPTPRKEEVALPRTRNRPKREI